jgi:DNA-binding LacI/PurR family transcriptional regulator
MLFANQVDGVLLSMSRETKDLNHLKIFQTSGIPVILYNRMIAKSRFVKVVADDYDGALKGVQHLIENGYKRIAHIAGPQALQISSNRLKGYRDALHKHGLPVDEELIVQHDLSRSNARECALHLLEKQNPPDAVFAVNDPAAIEVMLVAKEKGIRIPDQLGIVGFSNDQRSEIMEPGLTTLEQPISQMAKTSIDLLLQQIEDPSSPVSLLTSFKTNLIIRGSSSKRPF